MIYRQIIPPAPAYLGLNLCLKGTQMLPKIISGKKEKSKLDGLKQKSDRKYPQNEKNNSANMLLSPRSLLIDFDDKEKFGSNEFTSTKKYNLSKILLKKTSSEMQLNDERLPKQQKPSQLFINRCAMSKLTNADNENDFNSTRKSCNKVYDSSQRHASCGPKLISTQNEENKLENIDISDLIDKKIECIGNKCGTEVDGNDCSSAYESIKSSPRKQSLETPRITNTRCKLKPINSLSKSCTLRSLPITNMKEKPIKTTTTISVNTNEYRKYLTQNNLRLNRIPAKLSARDNCYSSHFFAVGLSLRAWRSKYSRIKSNEFNSNKNKTTNEFEQRKIKNN